MPSILRREFAPISAEAWTELESQAGDILRSMLTGRKIVDFSGPHGWDFAALNTGRLELKTDKAGSVSWGVRQVLPLIELRVPFTLNQFEIDNITRGSKDADLDSLTQAAEAVASFENEAIFNGFKKAAIQGLTGMSSHKAIKLPKDANDYTKSTAQAVKTLAGAGIGGPYALVLGPDEYFELKQAGTKGYPPLRVVEETLDGSVLLCPAVKGGVVVSTRGGDFELVVGKDISIGYAGQDREKVDFFLTESFTFRVLEPAAIVPLSPAAP